MPIRDGFSCPGCGLPNYEHELVPPFPSEHDDRNQQQLEESHFEEEQRREDEAAALDR